MIHMLLFQIATTIIFALVIYFEVAEDFELFAMAYIVSSIVWNASFMLASRKRKKWTSQTKYAEK